MTAPFRHKDVPPELHMNKRHILAFFQEMLDYKQSLIQVGMRVKQKSTVIPAGFLRCSGQTVSKADYITLWQYAENDSSFTRTASNVTLPTDVDFIVRVS